MSKNKLRKRVLPGFEISLGCTLLYLSLIVLIPFAAMAVKAGSLSWQDFAQTISGPRAISSYKVSFGCAFIAAIVNSVFGFILAWVLVRGDFAGKKIFEAFIDLPLALPTAVAGLALTNIYATHGFLGQWLEPLGIQVAYTQLGIVVAITFIGLPFVVRTVQPVLEDMDKEMEEAALSLGASPLRIFWHVILPNILPAILTGFALALSRGIGEFGSVIFISGNMPLKTEVAPLVISIKLEQYDYKGATAVAIVLLVASFLLLFFINFLQAITRKFQEKQA